MLKLTGKYVLSVGNSDNKTKMGKEKGNYASFIYFAKNFFDFVIFDFLCET